MPRLNGGCQADGVAQRTATVVNTTDRRVTPRSKAIEEFGQRLPVFGLLAATELAYEKAGHAVLPESLFITFEEGASKTSSWSQATQSG